MRTQCWSWFCLASLTFFLGACDSSCVLEGNEPGQEFANAKCVPTDGSYDCDRVCEAASVCPALGPDFNVLACEVQCTKTVAGINSHEYNLGVACLFVEGDLDCQSFEKCEGKVGVPIPGGSISGIWVSSGVEPTATENGLCNNDLDDDHDGEKDCMDSDCEWDPQCAEGQSVSP